MVPSASAPTRHLTNREPPAVSVTTAGLAEALGTLLTSIEAAGHAAVS